jgi:16S rRNA (cytosine1402-N4)-methyltransferase
MSALDASLATWRTVMSQEHVHIPVMVAEVVELLGGSVEADRTAGLIVDATLGAGGHSAQLLESLPGASVLGTDQDPQVLELARERLEPFGDRARLARARISDLSTLLRKLRVEPLAGLLMDLGVSSLQLDRAERGFSFQLDGPLDMRMDPERERTAADIVNRWDESDLADLFYFEGGETRSREVARAVVEARKRTPFRRTVGLALLVEQVLGRRGKAHPATRVFQALRRAVNEEGEELLAGLRAGELFLRPGGVLTVITFHSGEDGVVKRHLAEGARRGVWEVLTPRPLEPSRAELRANPRARSARVRAARRTAQPATEVEA